MGRKRKAGRCSTGPVTAGSEYNDDASYLFLRGGRDHWQSIAEDDFTDADRYDLRLLLGRFWNLTPADTILWEMRRREVEKHWDETKLLRDILTGDAFLAGKCENAMLSHPNFPLRLLAALLVVPILVEAR